MRRLLERIGVITFFAAWPLFFVYLRRSERTRIILHDEGRILVMRNWVSDGSWQLPGGGLHAREPIVSGALRELREETGIALEQRQLRFVAQREYRKYGHRFRFHIFVGQGFDATMLHAQAHEVARLEWVDYHLLTPQNASPDTLLAIEAWLEP